MPTREVQQVRQCYERLGGPPLRSTGLALIDSQVELLHRSGVVSIDPHLVAANVMELICTSQHSTAPPFNGEPNESEDWPACVAKDVQRYAREQRRRAKLRARDKQATRAVLDGQMQEARVRWEQARDERRGGPQRIWLNEQPLTHTRRPQATQAGVDQKLVLEQLRLARAKAVTEEKATDALYMKQLQSKEEEAQRQSEQLLAQKRKAAQAAELYNAELRQAHIRQQQQAAGEEVRHHRQYLKECDRQEARRKEAASRLAAQQAKREASAQRVFPAQPSLWQLQAQDEQKAGAAQQRLETLKEAQEGAEKGRAQAQRRLLLSGLSQQLQEKRVASTFASLDDVFERRRLERSSETDHTAAAREQQVRRAKKLLLSRSLAEQQGQQPKKGLEIKIGSRSAPHW
eukprot:NODE_1805_length_1375_cov_47.218750_g1713_i0.p1 GENE.NODE_1805_length_1375_cov_47.218750_g1713_i0~~NODE_1805_length_1375_cov_47.218750_g1713_i0.p1  ORF type:complete len:403 (-),score=100.57 NODE_1805_length_1375_cov_47.218750_g1713_i0:123-1331(-)